MKRIERFAGNLILLFSFSLFLYSCNQKTISVQDENGVLHKTNAPVFVQVNLNENEITAGKDGRLALIDPKNKSSFPVQLGSSEYGENTGVIFMFPEKISETNEFILVESKSLFNSAVTASVDSASGQIIIKEDGKKVLQYNYQTVYEKDVIRRAGDKNEPLVFPEMSGVYFEEYLKSHPEYKKDTVVTGSIYSVPRSDYIHPLYGLEGEMLTNDWPDGGHPHHRGIFWAWPEVEYGTERGDIYALQRVFARPTGNIEFTGGSVFAQINAENLWMWEDTEPIVNEHAVIRVYHSANNSRVIDLTIKLLALKDSVTIATRFTNSYGGLNIRMQTPENQEISFFTDEKGSNPLRA